MAGFVQVDFAGSEYQRFAVLCKSCGFHPEGCPIKVTGDRYIFNRQHQVIKFFYLHGNTILGIEHIHLKRAVFGFDDQAVAIDDPDGKVLINSMIEY